MQKGQTFQLHNVLHFFHLNFICNLTFFRKKLFWPFHPIQRLRVCKRAEHLLAWGFMLHSIYFDMQHYYFQKRKKWPFYPTPGAKGKCYSKIFANMVLYASFDLIFMQRDHIMKKLILYKPMWPLGRVHFWPQGHNLNKLGRSPLDNKANSTNLYPPTKGYLRETCKSQNINPIYLTLSSPTVSFRS